MMRNEVLHIALAMLLFTMGTGTALAEESLTDILDREFPGGYQEVTNTNIYVFDPGEYVVTALLVDKESAYRNPTGWYEADSNTKHTLFNNPPNEVGTSREFTPNEQFGMYIDSSAGTFYSDASLNTGVKRARLFTINGGYVLAFEDGTDWDYQDIVVEIKGKDLTLIPEFPTVALPVAAILGLVFVFGRKKENL
jgi:hypothetical protein